MKKLLGRKYRPLVTMAKGFTRAAFLEQLTAQQAYVIRSILQMDPVNFWRAAKGRFQELPEQPGRLDATELAAIPNKPEQRLLGFGGLKRPDDLKME